MLLISPMQLGCQTVAALVAKKLVDSPLHNRAPPFKNQFPLGFLQATTENFKLNRVDAKGAKLMSMYIYCVEMNHLVICYI